METKPWVMRLAPATVLALIAGLVLVRISAFGIWDPWELAHADDARSLLSGDRSVAHPDLTTWAVALGFKLFGVHEWSGRMPVALAGLATVAIAFWLASRIQDRMTGLYAALIAGTSPLFLFNARQMVGQAPAFAVHGLLGLCLYGLVFPAKDQANTANATLRTALCAAGAAFLLGTAVILEGALTGALPPLLAASLVAVLFRAHSSSEPATRRAMVFSILGITTVLALLTVRAVVLDRSDWSPWLGGAPTAGNAPTFEMGFERVFHAFAPWSALLPIAMGAILWPPRHHNAETLAAAERARAGGLFVLLWAAAGYVALTIHVARYGGAVFLPIVPCAVAVALLLHQLVASAKGWWAAGLVAGLLVALQIRDFKLYPGTPTEGMNVADMTIPDVFTPGMYWAATLGLFAAAVFVAFSVAPSAAPFSPKAPYRYARDVWRMGLANKVWIVFGGLLCAALLVFAVVCMVAGTKVGLTTLAVKWGARLGLLPLALPLVVVAVQGGLFVASRLGQFRLVPMFVAALLTAGYASQGYLPALSEHFSPRSVYDRYNALAKAGEPLGEYRIGSRAAAYYANGKVEELKTQSDLVKFLAQPGRRWAVCPSDELSAIDRAFRHETNRHLFVADAKSARVILVASEPVAGTSNENFVADAVIATAPKMDHTANLRFEDRIQLLGYDIKLQHKDYAGAGETVTVTWYWKALRSSIGTWKIFVHVDGEGLRLNGDHEPVDGKYPVRMWDEGDIVVDKQELKIPANYRSGDYALLVGFYSGETRLKITEGQNDGDNRGRAGTLTIR